jgi:hypothetical protein
MCQACTYQPEWQAFLGAFIEDSDYETVIPNTATGQPRETPKEKPRESHSIPFEERDFHHDKSAPMETTFDVKPMYGDPELDPNMERMRRKQHQLLVIHEKFGHLSFSILMARVGLIPKELTNVPPPTCPGCAYGKAHHKPWHRKGTKNLRKLKVAHAPGQVVSIWSALPQDL